MKESNTKNSEHAKAVLHFTINKRQYEWNRQYITGAEVRQLGQVDKEDEIFLAIRRPWEDELIHDDTEVDLAREGIEHFFSKKKHEEHLVDIFVNDKEYKISRGKHTVAEIKKTGGVPANHELDELIDNKLTPLSDDDSVLIKGCEQFFGHVRDGASS
jgi:hypothetical protein